MTLARFKEQILGKVLVRLLAVLAEQLSVMVVILGIALHILPIKQIAILP